MSRKYNKFYNQYKEALINATRELHNFEGDYPSFNSFYDKTKSSIRDLTSEIEKNGIDTKNLWTREILNLEMDLMKLKNEKGLEAIC